MNLNLNHPLRYRLMNADLDSGGTDTGVVDRGDDFDPGAAAVAADAEAGKGAATEAATAAALEAELAAKAAEKATTPVVEEDDDEKDDKDTDKTKPRGKRIPLDRHEAILSKARETADELRRENAALKANKGVAALNDSIATTDEAITAMEAEYATLLTDGEIAKASAKMAEIRKAERDLSTAKTQAQIQTAVARATEGARYTSALERIEAEYSVLNEDHADFNPDVMAEVMLMKNGYEAQGFTPTQAMQKAVRKELGATTAAQVKTLDAAPTLKADTAAAIAAARKLAATNKTVAAVESTPASTTKVGIDSDKAGGAMDAKAVMKMSQEDFGKLNEETLSRMRGDTI